MGCDASWCLLLPVYAFFYTHIWYILGILILIPGLFLLLAKNKVGFVLTFIALALFSFNYYQIYKESNRFDGQNKKMALGIDFDLYIPINDSGSIKAIAVTGFATNPYLAIKIMKGLAELDLTEFNRAKTENTSGNCGPWNPELKELVFPQCDFYAKVPLGTVYYDQQEAYLTVNNTRIGVNAAGLNKDEIVGIFSSLQKTPKENIDFINKDTPTFHDAFLFYLEYLKQVLH